MILSILSEYSQNIYSLFFSVFSVSSVVSPGTFYFFLREFTKREKSLMFRTTTRSG